MPQKKVFFFLVSNRLFYIYFMSISAYVCHILNNCNPCFRLLMRAMYSGYRNGWRVEVTRYTQCKTQGVI
uniref:Uncharacterized protein n=1 Tax=Anguilla anguilla TaxID=7936 RepID=A0A0E9X5I9_ANGAN